MATEPRIQIAQAANEPIGRAETTDGAVWAVHADGAGRADDDGAADMEITLAGVALGDLDATGFSVA